MKVDMLLNKEEKENANLIVSGYSVSYQWEERILSSVDDGDQTSQSSFLSIGIALIKKLTLMYRFFFFFFFFVVVFFFVG